MLLESDGAVAVMFCLHEQAGQGCWFDSVMVQYIFHPSQLLRMSISHCKYFVINVYMLPQVF